MQQIDLVIEQKDALTIEGDVLALKFADALYGVDAAVTAKLMQKFDLRGQMPRLGESRIFDASSAITADRVLFVGVGFIYNFQYREIREFSRTVLASLAATAPHTQRLIVTLHGVGYGLDELEAFESEVAGFVDAITAGDYPKALTEIVFAERDPSRAERLRVALDGLLPRRGIAIPGFSDPEALGQHASDRLRGVGYDSAGKPHVFVAMPYADDMDDVYHYGIQGAVNSAGFLCERADLSSFTGDVMTWVRKRIESASLVIADLTGANANVYLEVGYAWGCDRPTVLLVRDQSELKFDVKGQRCLVYGKIRELEELLQKELEQLKLTRLSEPNA